MPKNRTIIYVIRECLLVFAVLGLWPSWHTPKFRRLHTFYSIFAICVSIGTFISSIFVHHIFEYKSLSHGVANVYILITLVAQFISVTQAFLYQTKQQQLVAKFAKVDQLIHHKLQVYISYRAEKRHILARIFAIGVGSFFIEIIIRTRLLYRGDLPWEIFWHCFFADCLARLRCIQVLVFVLLLRSRVNLLQNEIEEISIIHNRRLDSKATRWVPVFKDRQPIFVLNASAVCFPTYDRILHIKQVYGDLYEICGGISSTFGWSLLGFVIQSSIIFTSLR